MPNCNICKYAGRPPYKSPCSECKEFSEYEYESKKTNADRIRAMRDEELAEFIRSMVDGSYNYDFACYKYTNYATHHSDPANKGIYLYKCDDCESEGIGLDVLMWLQQPAEEGE